MQNAMPVTLFVDDFFRAQMTTACCNNVLLKNPLSRAQSRTQSRAHGRAQIIGPADPSRARAC